MSRLPRPRKTKAGTWHWRVATYRKPDGRRNWVTGTCASEAGANAAIAEVVAARHRGAPIANARVTVGEILATWRRARTRGKAAGTVRNYDGHLERIGRHFAPDRQASSITHADAEAFYDWLLSPAGGKRGKGLSAVTANATLGVAKGAFALAFDTGTISHRPFAPVRYLPPSSARPAWPRPHLAAFLAAAAPHPLFAGFLLSARGLRPEELYGLRWANVHLGAAVTPSGLEVPHGWLAITETRVKVSGREHIQPAKSWRGRRPHRLSAQAQAALVALQLAQRDDAEAMGAGYGARRPGYVLADPFGEPVPVHRLRAEFYKIVKAAGLPRIPFYALRATMNTELAAEGVGVAARARSLGHGQPVNLDTYTREDAELYEVMDRITAAP